MAINFDELDKQVDLGKLQNEVKEASENTYDELPKGYYEASIESMEIGETKDGRPMFKLQCRILNAISKSELDEEYDIKDNNTDAVQYFKGYKGKKKPCAFMNRVIYGTKNDGLMINSLVGWLKKLECEVDVVFEGYKQFNDLVLDIAEELNEYDIRLVIKYDKDDFNNITVISTYEAE